MRKFYLTLIAVIAMAQFSFAQWTTNAGNTITSTTNLVGIGTTTPRSSLDVGGGIQISGVTSATPNNNGLVYGLFPYQSVGLGIYSAASSPNQGIGIWTNPSGTPTEVMRILSGGNVGIGTTTPTARLSIAQNTSGLTNEANVLLAGAVSVLGSTAGSYLYPFEFRHSNTANYDRLQITPYRRTAGTTWSGTAYRLQFAVDGSYTDGSKAFIEIGGSDPTVSYGGFVSIGTGGVDRLCILNNGNVLIGQTVSGQPGQTNSAYKLDVAGGVRANSIVVNTTGADFVFKPTYKLAPLATVEQYITQNHHLPEIPSAIEMQKDGLNVGENQVKLLQKVEELTLYMIEKDKQLNEEKLIIDKQQKDNDAQKQANQQLSDQVKSQQKQIDLLIKQVTKISNEKE